MLKENTNKKIRKIIAEQGMLAIDNEQFTLDSTIRFLCPEHGEFRLSGLDVRYHKNCPDCKEVRYQRFQKYIVKSPQPMVAFKQCLNSFHPFKNEIDLTGITFKRFTDTIRPSCTEHGQFITTPEKLLHGDKCKWCDGIKSKNNELVYNLSQKWRLIEKIKIKFPDTVVLVDSLPDVFTGDTYFKVREGKTLKWKKPNDYKGQVGNHQVYTNHLKTIRDAKMLRAFCNSILFKISVTDTSTKMGFTVIHSITLNANQLTNAHKIMTERNWDFETLKEIVTPKLIDEFFQKYFNAVVPGSKKKPKFEFDILYSSWDMAYRNHYLIEQYKYDNKSKSMIIPRTGSFAQIKHKFNCYWSEFIWDSTQTSVNIFRDSLYAQKQLCPICSEIIRKPVVDHEHKKKIKGTGRIRDNICDTCNTFISRVENNCKRHNISLEALPQVLKNMSGYFHEQQYQIVHYTDKDKRPKLKKSQINRVLKYFDLLFPNKKKRPKVPASMIVTKEWGVLIKTTEDYLKNPFPKLYKRDWDRINKHWNAISHGPKPTWPKHGLRTPEINKWLEAANKINRG